MFFRYQSDGNVYTVSIDKSGNSYQAWINGESYTVEVLDDQPGQLSLLIDGLPRQVFWAGDANRKWISLEGCTYLLEKPTGSSGQRAADASGSDVLRAPMPAQVRALQAAPGDWIEKGQTLLILEAMKMEIRIQAPGPGRLSRFLVAEGQSVDRNQALAEMRHDTP